MIATDYAIAALLVVSLVALVLILRIKPAKNDKTGWIHGSQSD